MTKRVACLMMLLGAWCFARTVWAEPIPLDPPDGDHLAASGDQPDVPMLMAQVDRDDQGGDRDPGQADAVSGPPGMPRQARMFEQFRLMKMLELLDLTDAQEGPFMTTYQKLRKGLRDADERKRKAVDDLSASVKAKSPSDQDINKRIDILIGLEQERRDLLGAFAKDARHILTAPQAGRLMLFIERFEPAVAERIQAMRRGKGAGMGPGMRRQMDSSGDTNR